MANIKFGHGQLSVKICILYDFVCILQIFRLVMNKFHIVFKNGFIWKKKLCYNHPGQKSVMKKYSQYVACVQFQPGDSAVFHKRPWFNFLGFWF